MVFDFKNTDEGEESFVEELIENYPIFWRKLASDKYSELSLASVGEGWYDIIRLVSKQAENLIASIRHDYCSTELPYAAQVKEKFGQMRLYIDYQHLSSDVAEKFIDLEKQAAEMAGRTCFECSNDAKMRFYPPFEETFINNGWRVNVLCKDCWFLVAKKQIKAGVLNYKKARTWLYHQNIKRDISGGE